MDFSTKKSRTSAYFIELKYSLKTNEKSLHNGMIHSQSNQELLNKSIKEKERQMKNYEKVQQDEKLRRNNLLRRLKEKEELAIRNVEQKINEKINEITQRNEKDLINSLSGAIRRLIYYKL